MSLTQNPFLLLLILISVLFSAVAQLLLKMGVAAVPKAQGVVPVLIGYATTPAVIGGFALYGLGAVLWLFVLARLPLSAAYPFVGLGFIATMLIGFTILGEPLSWERVAGTLLIAVGCVLVARSVG